MTLVLTLTTRNEVDLIEAHIAYHLHAGVDHIIVTDNDSDDGTTDVLDRYARDGRLEWTSAPDPHFNQMESITRMAREAATRHGADWVINCDADEFWWPRFESLKGTFSVLPPRFGAVRGMLRHFAPRPESEPFFAERMTVRVAMPVTDRDHTFSPHFKTAHRGDPEMTSGAGSHEVFGPRLLLLRGWYPFDILHFPLRSQAQCEHKYLRWWQFSQSPRVPAPRVQEFYDAYQRGESGEYYEARVVNDEQLAAGLRDGTYEIDTRLRDVLRMLRVPGSHADEPAAPAAPTQPADRAYLSELGALEAENVLVRTQRRVDSLENRLDALERSLPARLRARVRVRGVRPGR